MSRKLAEVDTEEAQVADLPADPDNQATDEPSPPGMPRWVKISGIVVLVLVLLLVVVFVFDIGGTHGPGQHQAMTSAIDL